MKSFLSLCALALTGAVVATTLLAQNATQPSTPTPPATAPAPKTPALAYTVKDIDGKDVDLAKTYAGKVVMIVNVASKCGNTPQYTALEAIYKKYKDQGFVVVGFPANNFAGQEPGTNEQIKDFCTGEDSQYKISFPLMSKMSVKGADISPLYKNLITQESAPVAKGDVAWNFEKFLIGKDGKVAARFHNRMKPDDATITKAIEEAIAVK